MRGSADGVATAGSANVIPLIALDAVVLDTETTGLDPARARIVEVGALRLRAGRVAAEDAFRQLVNPGEPIPHEATKLHGIDAATVAEAAAFPGVWPQLAAYLGGAIVIGHSLGFDLAVLKRECERAGIEWRKPRTLDTRLLAQVAEPTLPGYSLDQLAAWLDVTASGRHSALGDARTTADIFCALAPRLRERGIRTVAEAMQACRALTDVLDEQHRAGWIEAVEVPGRRAAEGAVARIDSYPYRHRVSAVMSAPPKFIAADATLAQALEALMRDQVSSLYVTSAHAGVAVFTAAELGILTERDVLRALARHGAAALQLSAGEFASRPLATAPAEAFVYRAIGRMARLKVRHLGVADEVGNVVGALSARDLLRLRAGEAVSLGDEIEQSESVHDLSVAWAKLPQVAAALAAEGVSGPEIAAVISRELGELTRKAAAIAEARMAQAGQGGPPCPYALAVLGSAGRGESLLALDQDNALAFAEGAPDGAEDRWFAALAAHVADILHEVGVPYCRGGVMAKNPQWRGSLSTWRQRIADWIRRSRPQDLLSVDIFFDMRGVHGDVGLTRAIWREAFDAADGQAAFAKLLAESAGAIEPGLNFFGRFRTEKGRIDLKKCGLFGIVTAARALAIRHHVVERSTPARLAGVKALGIGGESDLEALGEAQAAFLDFIVAQQIEDLERGVPPSNAVETKRLSRRERERLRMALESVAHLDALTRDLLFKH